MIDLLTASNQRKFKLVQLLNQSDSFVHIDTIAAHLDAKVRTVYEDIRELGESDLSHTFQIEARSKEYSIRFKDNCSIDSLGKYIMENNKCFQILEYTFFNKDVTVEDLADLFNISLPTVYRLISRINTGLKKNFNLKFYTSPCCLEGDEYEVRSFYLQYFTERYSMKEWPFSDINHDKLLKLFTVFTNNLNFKLQYSDLMMLKYSLAVSHVRVSQGHIVNNTGIRTAAIIKKLNSSEAFYKIFADIFNGEFEPLVYTDNLSYVISDYFFFNHEELLHNAAVDSYSARSYIRLTQIINELATDFNIPIENREMLIYNIHNSAQLGVRNINVRPLIINNKYVLLQQFRDLFPKFYGKLKIQMEDYISLMDIKYNEDFIYHLMHSFVTRWENLLEKLLKSQRKIKIKVVSIHDIYHAKLMKSILKIEFYEQVDVELIDSYDIEALLDTPDKVDIMVSNFTLPVSDSRVIAVNDIPTNRDFSLIKNKIKEIRLRDN
ncbi:helix-turn-helix domain-containing protein [Jeotgalicoccus psychrophilus]|uniref:helix-turn-helix domain-containing protein n=1 Tax=Jeotgalicoccus psychrophilus TaxID=157228 RepID=UPI0004045012|nr:helix-turn-helix domain-containing protein [Jeotgalicoccus psychrophilus]